MQVTVLGKSLPRINKLLKITFRNICYRFEKKKKKEMFVLYILYSMDYCQISSENGIVFASPLSRSVYRIAWDAGMQTGSTKSDRHCKRR